MSKKYLTTIFFVTSLVVTLLFNSLLNTYKGYKLANMFSNNTSKIISLSCDDSSKLTNILSKYDKTSIYLDDIWIGSSLGQAILFNNFNLEIPILEGRFLSEDDFSNKGSNYIVIGKALEKYINIIDNKKYIKINDVNYEVIGVMGYEDRISVLDTRFYININCYLNNTIIDKNTKFVLTNKNNSYTDLLNELSNSFYDLETNDIEADKNAFFTIIENSQSLIILVAILAALFLLNIVNIASYYIKDKLKEIGIRRNYGANSFNIFKNILKDYVILISISTILSAIFYSLIIKLKIMPEILGSNIYLLPVFITYILTLLIGAIISLFTMIKVNKKSINMLIKGV